MSIALWALIVAIIAGCVIPFVLHWVKNREQIIIDLSVETEHHPDCIGAFHKSGAPRPEENRHDHMIKASLSITNIGVRPIRIRDITATGISNEPTKSAWQTNIGEIKNKEYAIHQGPSLLEQLKENLPKNPITNEDLTWTYEWSLIYTGCENRPLKIDLTVKTDRDIYPKTFETEDCSHELT